MTRMTKHLEQLAVALALIASVALAPETAVATEGYYLQRNLITNFRDKYRTRLEPGRTTLQNDLVLNAWGLALRPAGAGGHWWIANTDSGTVVTYVGDTDTTPLFQDALKTVRVEPAPARHRNNHRRRPARSSAVRTSSCARARASQTLPSRPRVGSWS